MVPPRGISDDLLIGACGGNLTIAAHAPNGTGGRAMTLTPAVSKGLLDVLIRAGLVAILAFVCYRIFFPFLNLLLWSMILAVMLYPLHKWFKRKLGGKNGLGATLVVLLSIAIVLVPVYLLASSLATTAQTAATTVRSGDFAVPPPAD